MPLINASRVLILLFGILAPLCASYNDTTATKQDSTTKRGDILGFPFIYYSPETQWAGGGRVGYYGRKNPSNVYVNLFISQKSQYELFFGGEIYKGLWKIIPKLKWSKWTDLYYGLGNNTPDSSSFSYDENFGWGFLSVQRRFGNLYAGLEIESRAEKVNQFLPGNPPGNGKWRSAGIGTRITYDTRDNIYYPNYGQFCEGSFIDYLPLQNFLAYRRLTIDYRYFTNIFTKDVMAFQLKTDFSSGNVPIQVIPSVGDLLRGYETYRYRDKTAIYGQAENRFPLWKKLSGVAFLGAGDVFNNFDNLSIARIKLAAGCGLRFRLTENKVNLRYDVAINRDSNLAMYLELAEAF